MSALGFLAMISLKVLLLVSRFALVASSIGVLSTISHGNERFVSGFEDLRGRVFDVGEPLVTAVGS